MIALEDQFELNPQVVYTRLDDAEAVLLHLETHYYYSLNETGMLIWERLGQRHNVQETATALSDHYEIEMDQAVEAVRGFIEDLKQDGLIRQSPTV